MASSKEKSAKSDNQFTTDVNPSPDSIEWDPYLRCDESQSAQISIRSILIGGLLGAFVSAGAMYISFKAGNSFSSALFCAIVGFSIMKPLSTRLPVRFGGGYFGPKENATLQTAGNAASGLSAGFTVAIPVLYWIHYLHAPISNDIWSLFFWTLAAAYYGLFFAVPLRHMMIIKQKLRFPTGSAAAYVIQALHESAEESKEGKEKAQSIFFWFSTSFGWTLFTQFFPFLYNMPIFYYIYQWSHQSAHWALAASDWRWALNISPAMFGSGMMMGVNVAVSLFFGGLFCWGLLGPLLLRAGWVYSMYGYEGDFVRFPSAQYWLLWPGITIMLVGSFFELFWNWKTIYEGFRSGWYEIQGFYKLVVRKVKKDLTIPIEIQAFELEDDVDPAPLEERVPFLWWSSGLLVSSAFTVAVLTGYWNVLWYEVILAILLAFLLSFMACQVYGETDNNPQGIVAKASQFVFSGFNSNQAINVICGNISLCSSGQAGDMLQDLKTGHILSASPRAMFWGQVWGSLFGVFSNIAAFYLIASAYPCLMELPTTETQCNFNMPAAQSWFGVSYALTHGFSKAVPVTSAWACLVVGICTLVLCYIKKKTPERYSIYVMNPLAFGMAWTYPTPGIMLAQGLGGVFMKMWQKFFPDSYEKFGYTVAAGLMTGEGIGGLFQAILILCGVTWQSPFGVQP